MKLDKHIGECAICGKMKKLTFEHIPPKAAFNGSKTKQYNISDYFKSENMPWDFTGLKYRQSQKGNGFYSLCRECNNNTGAWYGKDYCDFITKLGNSIIQQRALLQSQVVQIDATDIYPLRILKQIISMFLSLNRDFDLPGLKEFVLDKNSKSFDKNKYKICIYLFKGTVIKFVPFCVLGNIKTFSITKVSEIADFPIGMILYIDPNDNTKIEGTDITEFSSFNYDEKQNILLPLYCKDVNTPFPCDFRTKSEIMK